VLSQRTPRLPRVEASRIPVTGDGKFGSVAGRRSNSPVSYDETSFILASLWRPLTILYTAWSESDAFFSPWASVCRTSPSFLTGKKSGSSGTPSLLSSSQLAPEALDLIPPPDHNQVWRAGSCLNPSVDAVDVTVIKDQVFFLQRFRRPEHEPGQDLGRKREKAT
jgi:hypothetical protein